MFPFHMHHRSQATLYHDQFVDPEAGLDEITPLDSGTLREMVNAAMRLPEHQFRACFIKVDGRTMRPAEIRQAADAAKSTD